MASLSARISDLTAAVGAQIKGVKESLASLDADYQNYKDTSASIEELSFAVVVAGQFFGGTFGENAPQGNTFNQTAWTAPFDCEILSCDVRKEYTDVAASDVNYLRLQINRYRDVGGYDLIAEKTTKVTGGEPIVAKHLWSFDGVTFNAANAVLSRGDALALNFGSFGTSVWRFPVNLTFRYRPYGEVAP